MAIDNSIVAVDIDDRGDAFRVGEPRTIFHTRASSSLRAWDVIPGTGRIVVINKPSASVEPLTMVVGLGRLLAESER
jgi:hypothetical protein